ncbi:hypothetical protein ACFL6S_28000 [Candidatus Poribacteria bacterium]
MKARYLMVFLLGLAVTMFWSINSGYAEIYFLEDFESFSNGDDIAEKSDPWEVLDDAGASGIASTEVSHTGQVSCVLDGKSCIGYNLALNQPDLPDSYVASVWYYHDAGQSPPPDANFIFGDVVPVWHDAILAGTRSVAPDPKNYTYRDKKGTGAVEDTDVPRKTGWIHLAFVIGQGETELYIDGQQIYESEFGSETYTVLCCERVWDVATGAVYYDNFVLADTMEETIAILAVEPVNKLTTTWGQTKRSR